MRGYLLEEALAWLLRNSGYDLITSVLPGDPWLVRSPAGLAVRGRGADHQADVLGEFAFTPPFSLPIRMFVEAKFHTTRIGLDTVRNAWATVSDVNEFDVGSHSHARYRYVYALFSTSGFTADAQRFAVTHQISLIDLSLDVYRQLLAAIETAASQVHPHALGHGRVHFVRSVFRTVLDTAGNASDVDATEPGWALVHAAAAEMLGRLQAYSGGEFLLAFPPTPFVLTLTGAGSNDIEHFIRFAAERPEHAVHIRRGRFESETTNGWFIEPADAADAYRLTFSLPRHIEEWITDERQGRTNTRVLKRRLLSAIMIYRWEQGVPKVYQLRYSPAA
ncbi:hypothetical protein GCM10029963_51020 [Micromonospora andamanensis]|nr:hypothetical protein Vwe01_28420 [Micromonospora andamanensis]